MGTTALAFRNRMHNAGTVPTDKTPDILWLFWITQVSSFVQFTHPVTNAVPNNQCAHIRLNKDAVPAIVSLKNVLMTAHAAPICVPNLIYVIPNVCCSDRRTLGMPQKLSKETIAPKTAPPPCVRPQWPTEKVCASTGNAFGYS